MNSHDLEKASGGIVKQTKYLKKNPLRQYFIKQYLRSIWELTNLVPIQYVLDVGCGEGFVIQFLQNNLPSIHLIGIDIEPGVLKVAAFLNPSSQFAIAQAHQLPIGTQSVDLVLCNEILEHLDSPQEALCEIWRVSREYCIFSVPREPHYRLANMAIGANLRRWGDDIDHQNRWTLKQFLNMIGQQFDILQIRAPFPWIMVLCKKPTNLQPEGFV